MQRINVDLDRLNIRPLNRDDDISILDCTEDDGTDPLNVQDYLSKKAHLYHDGRASTVYVVEQDQRILAFFTLSMAGIKSDKIAQNDRLANYTQKSYPAVLLGQMGVDKSCRGQGLGQEIWNYCLAHALDIGERIACRYIIVDTNQDKAGYYREKCKFKHSFKKDQEGNIVTMYRRLEVNRMTQTVNETVQISETVSSIITRVSNEEERRQQQQQSSNITTEVG
jgi:GNAT superfamily N-acetyltransferase